MENREAGFGKGPTRTFVKRPRRFVNVAVVLGDRVRSVFERRVV